jgi:hypothetical protein
VVALRRLADDHSLSGPPSHPGPQIEYDRAHVPTLDLSAQRDGRVGIRSETAKIQIGCVMFVECSSVDANFNGYLNVRQTVPGQYFNEATVFKIRGVFGSSHSDHDRGFC